MVLRQMRIIFLASGAFAQPTLRWLAQSQHEVALVVTQPAKGSGRGRHLTRTPVRALADELGLETWETENVNAPEVIARLRSLDARLGLVIAFGQKLGPDLLGSMPGGCINLHASLLPKYRGAAPINRAVMHGEKYAGCTVFRITNRMDAGPILVSRSTEIRREETAGELHDRLAEIGVEAMESAIEMFEGDDIPAGAPQDEKEATLAPKLNKSDGVVDFNRPASQVAHHICGMTPWPGASARFEAADGRWENVTFLRARASLPLARGGTGGSLPHPFPRGDTGGSSAAIPPGTIDARRYVAARDGFVEILEIKPSSGRSMTWPDYVNGRHVSPGDRFTNP